MRSNRADIHNLCSFDRGVTSTLYIKKIIGVCNTGTIVITEEKVEKWPCFCFNNLFKVTYHLAKLSFTNTINPYSISSKLQLPIWVDLDEE